MTKPKESKICATCGKPFAWRKNGVKIGTRSSIAVKGADDIKTLKYDFEIFQNKKYERHYDE
ncbi:hypothetical protein SAMN05421540_10245 [Psychroflexus halocasei]|uniref:DUF2256 domain-containing protein n=1 Tax=Psychroflexus halocasei TaxID=908615 RepID=A0A1H3WMV3_9FLAO|nr:hypothetical protein SAMN05421540_10245 [Psychroflexus halocasei]